MTKTRILTLAALGLLALATFTPTSQAACIGIGVEGVPLQAEGESTSGEATCVGIDEGQLPPGVVGAVNGAAGLVLGIVLGAVEDLPGVTPPSCTEEPPLFIPAECTAWLLGRIDPTVEWATSTEEGAESLPNWMFEAGEWNAAANQWANGYATYLSAYEAGAQGGASSYAVAEGLSQMGYGLGRASAAGTLTAEQAGLVADWFGAAQAALAAYATTESNELAANEVSFVQAVDAYLRGTESDWRAYAIALESYHVCTLGSDECGAQPAQPTPRQQPQHQTHTPDTPPSLGEPGLAAWETLVVGPTTQPYTPPGTPDTPQDPPEFPMPPEPPLEEEPEQ